MNEPATQGNSGPMTAHSPLGFIAKRALDILLPPQCLACGALVDEQGSLCSSCWSGIVFSGSPQCEACGLPFEYDLGKGTLCGSCTRAAPVFQRARAAMIYNDASRGLVLSFKYGDRTDAAPAFGRWLARAGKELIDDAGLVAPVPLHWSRLFTRRFNQAALLSREVGKLAGLKSPPDLLIRRRRTPPQGRLSPSARKANLKGAIKLNPAWSCRVEGLRILLIDDVFTTGATVSACARVLLRAGAGAVDVLTLARVMRPAF